MSQDNTSVIGYASSADGYNIDERLDKPVYIPRENFEAKLVPNGNSGCEDPRLTLLDGRIYMLYTAFNGHGPPRVAMTSISRDDFLQKNWRWTQPALISVEGYANKDAVLFPEKIAGRYAIIHRPGNTIWLDLRDTLEFEGDRYLAGTEIITSKLGDQGAYKVGAAGPPVKTEYGWILFYHEVNDTSDARYSLMAALLDLNNPSKVLGVTESAILEPEMPYEKEGQVKNVVFPCGNVLIGDHILVYYGGGDSVVGVAGVKYKDLCNDLLAKNRLSL
jgi:predicted GH43/DUF377 family glycosyl hydrolase